MSAIPIIELTELLREQRESIQQEATTVRLRKGVIDVVSGTEMSVFVGGRTQSTQHIPVPKGWSPLSGESVWLLQEGGLYIPIIIEQ